MENNIENFVFLFAFVVVYFKNIEGFIHCIIIENLCVKGYKFLQSNTFRFNFRVLTRM